MNSEWNRKERYMFNKHELTRHIKLLNTVSKQRCTFLLSLYLRKTKKQNEMTGCCVLHDNEKRNKYNQDSRTNSQEQNYTIFQKEINMKCEKNEIVIIDLATIRTTLPLKLARN